MKISIIIIIISKMITPSNITNLIAIAVQIIFFSFIYLFLLLPQKELRLIHKNRIVFSECRVTKDKKRDQNKKRETQKNLRANQDFSHFLINSEVKIPLSHQQHYLILLRTPHNGFSPGQADNTCCQLSIHSLLPHVGS